MSETYTDILNRIAGFLHYIGKYGESRMLVNLGRFLREKGIHLEEDLKERGEGDVLVARARLQEFQKKLDAAEKSIDEEERS